MEDYITSVFWRKLTRNDFEQINAISAKSGTGGGARHIPVGATSQIELDQFLEVQIGSEKLDTKIQVEGLGSVDNDELTFSTDPNRRSGEWRIADQYAHRCSAWKPENDFPTTYDDRYPPIIYIIKTKSKKFYAAFTISEENKIKTFPRTLANKWSSAKEGDKGIEDFGDGTATELSPIAIRTQQALEMNHNVLLYGPPGTGKTHAIQQLISLFRNDAHTRFVVDKSKPEQPFAEKECSIDLPLPVSTQWITFHQSYTYEDFILGLRPIPLSGGIKLQPRAGILLEEAEKVKSTKGSAVIFIDEVNRANVSSVLGEFITVMEKDKRLGSDGLHIPGRTIGIRLPSINDGEKVIFSDGERPVLNPYEFPYHVYLIATMNSLDRSVAPLDSALARRFYKIECFPDYTALAKRLELKDTEVPDEPKTAVEVTFSLLNRMNQFISALLGEDFLLGHSYMWDIGDDALDEEKKWDKLISIWEGSILPQMIELLRSNREALENLLKVSSRYTQKPSEYPYSSDNGKISDILEANKPIQRKPLKMLARENQKEVLRYLAKLESQ